MSETNLNSYTIDGDLFTIIQNDEGQYSIWPEKKTIPKGWKNLNFSGNKTEASQHIDLIWKDMRPKRLQK